jgi:hypothetical protein
VDNAGDLTEVCMAAGVLALERVTLFDLHRIIGTGLFSLKKSIGDSDCTTVPLPLIIITYTDRASWSLGGNGVRLLRAEIIPQ